MKQSSSFGIHLSLPNYMEEDSDSEVRAYHIFAIVASEGLIL